MVQVLVSDLRSDPGRLSNGHRSVVIKDSRPAIRGEKKKGQNFYGRFRYTFLLAMGDGGDPLRRHWNCHHGGVGTKASRGGALGGGASPMARVPEDSTQTVGLKFTLQGVSHPTARGISGGRLDATTNGTVEGGGRIPPPTDQEKEQEQTGSCRREK